MAETARGGGDGGGDGAGTTGMILVAVGNTAPRSLRRIIRRIDELPLGARVVMTLTKSENGVLFWTLQSLNGVER